MGGGKNSRNQGTGQLTLRWQNPVILVLIVCFDWQESLQEIDLYRTAIYNLPQEI
jgi:hypothetical protein